MADGVVVADGRRGGSGVDDGAPGDEVPGVDALQTHGVPGTGHRLHEFDTDVGAAQIRLALAEVYALQALAAFHQRQHRRREADKPGGGGGTAAGGGGSGGGGGAGGVSGGGGGGGSVAGVGGGGGGGSGAAGALPVPLVDVADPHAVPSVSELVRVAAMDSTIRREAWQLMHDLSQPSATLLDSKFIAARLHAAFVARDRRAAALHARMHELVTAAAAVEGRLGVESLVDALRCHLVATALHLNAMLAGGTGGAGVTPASHGLLGAVADADRAARVAAATVAAVGQSTVSTLARLREHWREVVPWAVSGDATPPSHRHHLIVIQLPLVEEGRATTGQGGWATAAAWLGCRNASASCMGAATLPAACEWVPATVPIDGLANWPVGGGGGGLTPAGVGAMARDRAMAPSTTPREGRHGHGKCGNDRDETAMAPGGVTSVAQALSREASIVSLTHAGTEYVHTGRRAGELVQAGGGGSDACGALYDPPAAVASCVLMPRHEPGPTSLPTSSPWFPMQHVVPPTELAVMAECDPAITMSSRAPGLRLAGFGADSALAQSGLWRPGDVLLSVAHGPMRGGTATTPTAWTWRPWPTDGEKVVWGVPMHAQDPAIISVAQHVSHPPPAVGDPTSTAPPPPTPPSLSASWNAAAAVEALQQAHSTGSGSASHSPARAAALHFFVARAVPLVDMECGLRALPLERAVCTPMGSAAARAWHQVDEAHTVATATAAAMTQLLAGGEVGVPGALECMGVESESLADTTTFHPESAVYAGYAVTGDVHVPSAWAEYVKTKSTGLHPHMHAYRVEGEARGPHTARVDDGAGGWARTGRRPHTGSPTMKAAPAPIAGVSAVTTPVATAAAAPITAGITAPPTLVTPGGELGTHLARASDGRFTRHEWTTRAGAWRHATAVAAGLLAGGGHVGGGKAVTAGGAGATVTKAGHHGGKTTGTAGAGGTGSDAAAAAVGSGRRDDRRRDRARRERERQRLRMAARARERALAAKGGGGEADEAGGGGGGDGACGGSSGEGEEDEGKARPSTTMMMAVAWSNPAVTQHIAGAAPTPSGSAASPPHKSHAARMAGLGDFDVTIKDVIIALLRHSGLEGLTASIPQPTVATSPAASGAGEEGCVPGGREGGASSSGPREHVTITASPVAPPGSSGEGDGDGQVDDGGAAASPSTATRGAVLVRAGRGLTMRLPLEHCARPVLARCCALAGLPRADTRLLYAFLTLSHSDTAIAGSGAALRKLVADGLPAESAGSVAPEAVGVVFGGAALPPSEVAMVVDTKAYANPHPTLVMPKQVDLEPYLVHLAHHAEALRLGSRVADVAEVSMTVEDVEEGEDEEVEEGEGEDDPAIQPHAPAAMDVGEEDGGGQGVADAVAGLKRKRPGEAGGEGSHDDADAGLARGDDAAAVPPTKRGRMDDTVDAGGSDAQAAVGSNAATMGQPHWTLVPTSTATDAAGAAPESSAPAQPALPTPGSAPSGVGDGGGVVWVDGLAERQHVSYAIGQLVARLGRGLGIQFADVVPRLAHVIAVDLDAEDGGEGVEGVGMEQAPHPFHTLASGLSVFHAPPLARSLVDVHMSLQYSPVHTRLRLRPGHALPSVMVTGDIMSPINMPASIVNVTHALMSSPWGKAVHAAPSALHQTLPFRLPAVGLWRWVMAHEHQSHQTAALTPAAVSHLAALPLSVWLNPARLLVDGSKERGEWADGHMHGSMASLLTLGDAARCYTAATWPAGAYLRGAHAYLLVKAPWSGGGNSGGGGAPARRGDASPLDRRQVAALGSVDVVLAVQSRTATAPRACARVGEVGGWEEMDGDGLLSPAPAAAEVKTTLHARVEAQRRRLCALIVEAEARGLQHLVSTLVAWLPGGGSLMAQGEDSAAPLRLPTRISAIVARDLPTAVFLYHLAGYVRTGVHVTTLGQRLIHPGATLQYLVSAHAGNVHTLPGGPAATASLGLHVT